MKHAFTFSSNNPSAGSTIKTKEDLREKLANQKLQFRPEASTNVDAISFARPTLNFRSCDEISKAMDTIRLETDKYRKLEKSLENKGRSRSIELVSVKCKLEALRSAYDALKWVTNEWNELTVLCSVNH